MRFVSSGVLLRSSLLAVAGLVSAGCGAATNWTTLHADHLPGGRQYVVQGLRDANGYCGYDFSWLPPGTMEEDVARDDSTCHLIAEVAPTVPNRPGASPSRIHVRDRP
jgi:hypothetical protein